ncbi:hypothetical protein ACHQM5_024241 [Ranunculus cassubicifolius]
MTEYWVSQGNKWCDICKIFISNNPMSIGTHERGEKHKEAVAKRIITMRKENAAKEKEQKNAARALEQIEAKANRSYQKDLAAQRGTFSDSKYGWELDTESGYYFNQASGYYYDPKSRLYYSEALGKWTAEDVAFPKSQVASASSEEDKHNKGTPPGLVISGSVNPKRSVKGAPSSIAVNKRKRQDVKPKVVSKEEADALKAREAAKKRMEEREKPMLGLYRSY